MKLRAEPTKNYRLLFSLYFLGFGILVALITSFINYSASVTNIEKRLQHMAVTESQSKREHITNYIDRAERLLFAITDNQLTRSYLLSPGDENRQNLIQLLYALSMSSKDIMQLRYLDASGREVVRINRDKSSASLRVAPDDELQDKGQRYYFKAASKLGFDEVWHSNIDLNIENGQIEKPYRPTLRLATPLIIDNQFQGVVIVNLLFENEINFLTNNPDFLVYLVDKDGEIIHDPDTSGSWSRYLDNKQNMQDLFPEAVEGITSQDNYKVQGLYSFSMTDLFNNDEGLRIVFVARPEVMNSMKSTNMQAALLVAFTVLLVSVPLSWFISLIPSKLQSKLSSAYNKIHKNAVIIDKYVMLSTTDTQGNIKEVSSRFAEVTGYSSEQLIGKRHNLIRHPDTPPSTYEEMWGTILGTGVWEGEMKNRNKRGESYWIHSIINPNLNSASEIEGFTAVDQDITDKKRIEALSMTDSLTGLYNRHKLNELLLCEVSRSSRYQTPTSVILVDVDYFKRINDSYGHNVGDDVLVQLAAIFRKNSRESDCLGRWGGEEFLIITSNSDARSAVDFAEKLRAAIHNELFPKVGHISVSCGVAQYVAGQDATQWISSADKALYQAKEAGRNRVVRS